MNPVHRSGEQADSSTPRFNRIEVRDHESDAPAQPAEPAAEPPRPRGRLEVWLPTVRFALVCAALWFGVRTVAPSYAIEGESMSPTFHDGGRVILNGIYHVDSPDRGDIIVFTPPYQSDKPFIKRVIGLPGDTVDIHDGAVFLNGERQDEDYLRGTPTTCFRSAHCRMTIPEGMVFVLGDNRSNSSDSRVFGPIPTDAIIGEVVFSLWPLHTID